MPVVAGTLNGVGTCSTGTQRESPQLVVAIFFSPWTRPCMALTAMKPLCVSHQQLVVCCFCSQQ